MSFPGILCQLTGKLMKAETLKRCCRCRDEKPLSEFNRDSGARDGLNARCKPCHRETSLAWKTSDKGKAAGRKYHNSERGREMQRLRRARIKQNKQTTKIDELKIWRRKKIP